jgi:hypothetical protein
VSSRRGVAETETGVLYQDGHFYKKDKCDKVSFPTTSIGTKISKATGKPHKHTVFDLERSAVGKPNSCVTNLDGVNTGTVDNGTVDNVLSTRGFMRGQLRGIGAGRGLDLGLVGGNF